MCLLLVIFFPCERMGKYGRIRGIRKIKNFLSLSDESVKLIVETRYGFWGCGKGMSLEDVFLPIYVFKKDSFFIRFFFADTYACPDFSVCYPQSFLKFVGNINVFCWQGNRNNIGNNNDGALLPWKIMKVRIKLLLKSVAKIFVVEFFIILLF